MRTYLIDLRTQHNETQQDVADALGLSLQYYIEIENGRRQKRMDMMLIASIASHFRISAAQIVMQEQALAEKM